jgi:chondroitin sulfate proteoglycan 4
VQSQVQLVIDDIYNSTESTPGRFFELNVNHGVYLGGMRTNNGVFLGLYKKYRGCLDQVMFNSMDILQLSSEHTDPLNRYGVTYDCSSEFSATSELPVTFLNDMSFIAFPGLETRSDIFSFTFDLRTRSQNALFLYYSGRAYNSDFIVVEILNGQIALTVNKGNGAIEFVSNMYVSDGVWHQVEVVVDHINIRLGVDGVRKERRSNFGDNHFLDLDGYMFVGGLDVKTRAKAMRYQLPSIAGANAGAGSVIGCMQNFKVNGLLFGFREADVTKDIRAECLWSFPCSNAPCVERAECIEEGYYHYRCICDRPYCFKTGQSEAEVPSLPVTSVIHVQDIVVREGESALITTNNIDLFVDYSGYGISSNAVIYTVVNQPEYGTIKKMAEPSEEMEVDSINTFSQYDLVNNKISYVHDGSESYSDSIGIEVSFRLEQVTDLDNLPIKFHQKYGVTLIIQIAPWNDSPVLYLPPDSTLTLVENTFIVLNPDLLEAEDRDDRPRNLEFTVQYQQGHDVGYFEIADTLGTRARITQFTQEDINEGRIKFVHRGALKQQFRIQVSDGKDTCVPQMLLVQAVPLQLKLIANTGIELLAGSSVLITSANLTYQTNAQNIDIR